MHASPEHAYIACKVAEMCNPALAVQHHFVLSQAGHAHDDIAADRSSTDQHVEFNVVLVVDAELEPVDAAIDL